MSELALKNVGMRYGDAVVLERLNLTTPGTFCAVVRQRDGEKHLFEIAAERTDALGGVHHLGGRPLPQEPGPERGVVYRYPSSPI